MPLYQRRHDDKSSILTNNYMNPRGKMAVRQIRNAVSKSNRVSDYRQRFFLTANKMTCGINSHGVRVDRAGAQPVVRRNPHG